MKRSLYLFSLALIATGCSSDDKDAADDTADDTTEVTDDTGETDDTTDDTGTAGGTDDTGSAGTTPDVNDLLDLSGSWSGDCEIADALFGDSTEISMTLTSTDQLGYYDNVQGRVLTGTGTVTVYYGGADSSWSTDIEGISTDNAVLLIAHEPAGNWLLEVDAGANTDTITGACGVAAWSIDLLEFVYFWGDLSMTRD